MLDMSVKQANPSYQDALSNLIQQLEEMLPAEQFAVFNTDAEALAKRFMQPLKLHQGDVAPSFTLPNALDKSISLDELLSKGKVILTFYRGNWCPYCNLQLRQFQEILPQIHETGASLVAISPQTPDHSLDLKQKNELAFEVLSDLGNQVARQFTTVFKYGDAPLKAMEMLGFDFYSFYGDDSGEIPVPATFIIDQDGTITYAFSAGGDYRKRPEPQDILHALR